MIACFMVYKRFGIPKLGLSKPKQETETTEEETPVSSETTHAHEDDSHAHGHGHGEPKKKKAEVSNGKAMTAYRSNKELIDIVLSGLIVLIAYIRYGGMYGDAAYVVLGFGVYYGLSRESEAIKIFAWIAGAVIILHAVFPNIAERLPAWDPLAPKETTPASASAPSTNNLPGQYKLVLEPGKPVIMQVPGNLCSQADDGKPGISFIREASNDGKYWQKPTRGQWTWVRYTAVDSSTTITHETRLKGTCDP